MGYLLTSETAIRTAEELARRTGRTVDDVIEEALREKLSRGPEAGAPPSPEVVEARHALMKRIQEENRDIPPITPEEADRIIGYDAEGKWS